MDETTEYIDMLYLELSQFTRATTKKELELRKENQRLTEEIKTARNIAFCYQVGEQQLRDAITYLLDHTRLTFTQKERLKEALEK